MNSQLYLSTASGNLVRLDTHNGRGTIVGDTRIKKIYAMSSFGQVAMFGVADTTVMSIDPLTAPPTRLFDYG